METTSLPTFRGRIFNSGEYIIGDLFSRIDEENLLQNFGQPRGKLYFIKCGIQIERVEPDTVSIHFPNMKAGSYEDDARVFAGIRDAMFSDNIYKDGQTYNCIMEGSKVMLVNSETNEKILLTDNLELFRKDNILSDGLEEFYNNYDHIVG